MPRPKSHRIQPDLRCRARGALACPAPVFPAVAKAVTPARTSRAAPPAAVAGTAKAVPAKAVSSGVTPTGPLAGLLSNRAPTHSLARIGQDSAGLVTGDLNGYDPDGNAVTFTVTSGPAHGGVSLDATGRYT